MREYLTIGEAAEFLNTTTSCLRFYEKKGLVKPYKIDDNGYRLYSFAELDYLEIFLLLREIDVPIKKLKSLVEDYSTDSYIALLTKSLDSVNEEMHLLAKRRDDIINRIQQAHAHKNNMYNTFKITKCNEKSLYQIHTGPLFEYSVKEVYDLYKGHHWLYADYEYKIVFIPVANGQYNFCLEIKDFIETNSHNHKQIKLEKGHYLTYVSKLEDYETVKIKDVEGLFASYLQQHDLSQAGPLIIQEETNSIVFDPLSPTLHYKMLVE